MEPEKTISSRMIYKGRILNLRLDTVRLSSGRVTEREIIEHRGSVAIVPIDDEGQVVLVRQYRKPVEDTFLEIPAGTLDSGEDHLAAAERELAEETGYRSDSLIRLGGYYSAAGFCNEYLNLYLARHLVPVQSHGPEADEIIQVIKVPFGSALEMVKEGTIRDGKSIIGLLLARDYLQVNPA